jgi:hypothetical protein
MKRIMLLLSLLLFVGTAFTQTSTQYDVPEYNYEIQAIQLMPVQPIDYVIQSTIDNLDMYQCTHDVIYVDDVIVQRTIINDYKYHKRKGTLMLMYTESTGLFGIKFIPKYGKSLKCWTYFGKNLSESPDLWSEVVPSQD